MSHRLIHWMLFLTCLFSFSQHAYAAALAIDGNSNPRIMPLGDSITAGYGLSVGGYRRELGDKLVSAGYSFTYVGSQNSYNPNGATGLNHEGHSGWTTPQITAIVTGSFSLNSTSAQTIISTSNPNVVLLMIGTNDMIGGPSPTIQSDYTNLLNAIFSQNPSVRVIVYPMIYCSVFSDVQADNVTYGGRDIQYINGTNVVASREQSSLAHTITGFQRSGRRITFFDGMKSVVTAANCQDQSVLVDGVHPTSPTYVAMGNAVVRSLLDVTPGAVPPSIVPTSPSGMVATPHGNGFDLSWTVNSLNESGFSVEATTDPLFASNIVSFSVSAGSNSTTVSGLQSNTTYYLRVRAQNGAGGSAPTFPIKSISASGTSSNVAMPTFTPSAGTYSSALAVTIFRSTAGATIHYTTDGSTPTASSPVYVGPIAVAASTTIQAIATATGMTNSEVVRATYTVSVVVPPETVTTPAFSPAPGAYSSGQSVTIACNTSGATIRYTTDGSTPTASSPVYSGAISVSTTTTIQAIATAPGMTNSLVVSGTYTIAAGPVGTGTGLTGSYFPSVDFTGASITRVDAMVNFDWGVGSPIAGIPVDNFCVCWTGQVQAVFSEIYTFTTLSDDGVRLWINGQLLVDNWTDHAPIGNSGTITLVAGQKYDVKMEYYEKSGGAVAKLSWASSSTAKQIIPMSQFFSTGVSPGDLPAGWTAQDVGSVALGGSTTHSNGTWTVSGSGSDIWNNADGCRFASQRMTGDVQVTAQVGGLTNTDIWAKAGVMIRESLATGSRHASTFATAANGLAFQRRLEIDGASSHTAGPGTPAPYWVRIERAGNVVISYTSPNGTIWNEIRREAITMNADVYVGLAVTSHNNGALCTATFTNVQVVGVAAAAN